MYYQGDFYRGDFYRGDPGFFSFLGGLAKAAVGFIPGVGPTISKALEVVPRLGGGLARTAGLARPATSTLARLGMLGRGALAGVARHPVLSAAGAAGALGAAGLEVRHLRRRGGLLGAPAGRRRRINVCNQRALRRSLRRISGFARVARRVMHFTHPPRPGQGRGTLRFKFPKRKRAA